MTIINELLPWIAIPLGIAFAFINLLYIIRQIQKAFNGGGPDGPDSEPYPMGTPVVFDAGPDYLEGKVMGFKDGFYSIFTPDGITYFEIPDYNVSLIQDTL